MCIVAFISLSAGCAVLGGGSGDPAADDTQSAVNIDPSDSSNSPFSVPADDTSVDDDSGDDATVADTDTDTDTSKDVAVYDDVSFVTDPEDVDGLSFKAGEEKIQPVLIEVTGGSEEGFTWTHDMPAGFAIVPYNSSASRIQIKGNPTEDMVDEYTVTLAATDKGGEHGSAGISFSLVVKTSIPLDLGLKTVSDCGMPMTIQVLKNGEWGPVDEIAPELGFKGHEIQLRAMRGDHPAKGPLTWKWTSVVEDSLHCWKTTTDNEYQDTWVWYEEGFTEDCDSYVSGGAALKDPSWTQNAGWSPDGTELLVVPSSAPRSFGAKTDSNTLTLKGDFKYFDFSADKASPLPVNDWVDEKDPVETLSIAVKDSCGDVPGSETDLSGYDHVDNWGWGIDMSRHAGHKKLKFSLKYPTTSEGGRIEDVRVHMMYQDVDQLPDTGGHYKSDRECTGDYCDSYLSVGTGFLLVMTNVKWTSEQLDDYRENAQNWEELLKTAYGYAAYDAYECNSDGETGCIDRQIKKLPNAEVTLSVKDVDAIYLMWKVAPSYTDPHTAKPHWHADLDIQYMVFETDYYYSSWSDGEDIYNDNIIGQWYQIDNVLNNVGMMQQTETGKHFVRKALPNYE